jgi:hypothetical protein
MGVVMKFFSSGIKYVVLCLFDEEENSEYEKVCWLGRDGELYASYEDEKYPEYKKISAIDDQPTLNPGNTSSHINYLINNDKPVIVHDLDENRQYEISYVCINAELKKMFLIPEE